MRHVGDLPNEIQARQLSDYLLALDIKTKVDPEAEQWALWVIEEDDVPRAREEFSQFEHDPDHSRYGEARKVAESRRREEQRQAKDYQKKTIDVRRQWERPLFARTPVTTLLMAGSILTAALTSNFDDLLKLGDRTDRVIMLSVSPDRSTAGSRWDRIEAWRRLEAVRNGQFYRLVTPILLHFSILHLLFNMLCLQVLGGPIEMRRGSWRLLGIVLFIAVTSNLAQYFWSGPNFGGMSGVDFGLFAYIWMKSRYEPGSGFFMPPRIVFIMIAWLIYCFVGPMNIANVAHTVGLIAGGVIGLWGTFRQTRRG